MFCEVGFEYAFKGKELFSCAKREWILEANFHEGKRLSMFLFYLFGSHVQLQSAMRLIVAWLGVKCAVTC